MRKKTSFDPRALMEQAINVMRESVDERRGDGKACPKVGAVLLKPDGSVETAHRGELRDGDHAEYTLLERKNRDANLAGSILFATLEPCAPDSRRPPKIGCAERIVQARIKEVWVGIEDPDPTVDRKGIKFLQDAGISVQMFDADLQDIIREENKGFLDQAFARAAAGQETGPREITLTSLECTLDHVNIGDLSPEALESYRASAGINEAVDSPTFQNLLARQGLLKLGDGDLRPTGFGMLLFGKQPRTALPQSGLLGTTKYPDSEEIRNFDGPQVLVPEQALQWLRDKIPNPIDRSGARRRETNEPFFEMVREGIINALVHRDYDITGAKCQLIVTADRIVVMSPGRPVSPITLEQMKSFTAPMLSRNPVLHFVFARMEMAEERGLGLRSLQKRARDLGLPLPQYRWNDPYIELSLFRNLKSATNALSDRALARLSKAERKGWLWIARQGVTTSREYAEAMGIPDRTALNHLRHFAELDLLRRTGSGRNTRYQVA